MTYEQYIEETKANCAKVLSNCSAGELLDPFLDTCNILEFAPCK